MLQGTTIVILCAARYKHGDHKGYTPCCKVQTRDHKSYTPCCNVQVGNHNSYKPCCKVQTGDRKRVNFYLLPTYRILSEPMVSGKIIILARFDKSVTSAFLSTFLGVLLPRYREIRSEETACGVGDPAGAIGNTARSLGYSQTDVLNKKHF